MRRKVLFATNKASKALPILQNYQQTNYSCNKLTFDGKYNYSTNFCLQQKVKLFVQDMYDFFDKYDADYLLSQDDKLQEAIDRFDLSFNYLSSFTFPTVNILERKSNVAPLSAKDDLYKVDAKEVLKLPDDVLFVLKATYLRSTNVRCHKYRPLANMLLQCFPLQVEQLYNLYQNPAVLSNSKKQWEKETTERQPPNVKVILVMLLYYQKQWFLGNVQA